MQKPSIEEVLKYAKPQVLKFISQFASEVPDEHKEEIEQCAYVRLLDSYEKLEADLGWKSFVYLHCRGAVLDFLKFGKGFGETKWSISKVEQNGSKHISKIRERVSFSDDNNDTCPLEYVLGINGVFNEATIKLVNINWDLVSRMASEDIGLHCFAMHIRGFHLEEIAPVFGISRARVGQHIQAFVARFDDPEIADQTWFLQTCFAFGLCKYLGLPDQDQSEIVNYSVGWNLKPVDLDSLVPTVSGNAHQYCFEFMQEQRVTWLNEK